MAVFCLSPFRFLFISTYLSEICTDNLSVFPSHLAGNARGIFCISWMCIFWNEHKAIHLGTKLISHIANWRYIVVLIIGLKYSVVWKVGGEYTSNWIDDFFSDCRA